MAFRQTVSGPCWTSMPHGQRPLDHHLRRQHMHQPMVRETPHPSVRHYERVSLRQCPPIRAQDALISSPSRSSKSPPPWDQGAGPSALGSRVLRVTVHAAVHLRHPSRLIDINRLGCWASRCSRVKFGGGEPGAVHPCKPSRSANLEVQELQKRSANDVRRHTTLTVMDATKPSRPVSDSVQQNADRFLRRFRHKRLLARLGSSRQ